MKRWIMVQGMFVVSVIILVLVVIAYEKIYLAKKQNYTKLHTAKDDHERRIAELERRIIELEKR